MQTVEVTHQSGSYPIYIGSGLLQQADLIKQHIHGTQAMVVTNQTIAEHYLQPLLQLDLADQCDHIILPDGEQYKTVEHWQQILDALIAKQHHRDTTLIALGGGVIGDMTGFAAASYQRGVNFIQLPTTLLSQVDASIGGKTAVNHPGGKNMIGAFHQPQAVLIDIDTLQTLPEREFTAGMAEVIKAAIILDADFFAWLEQHIEQLDTDHAEQLSEAIRRSCIIKRDVVAADEFEHGKRALLNLGHTFGHAIEADLGYGTLLHGEAVAIGIHLAANLSTNMAILTAAEQHRIVNLLQRAKLPIHLPKNTNCDKLPKLMASDKKVLNNQLRLILIQSIGSACINNEVSPEQLRAVLK